jgi:hypothetical protein
MGLAGVIRLLNSKKYVIVLYDNKEISFYFPYFFLGFLLV